MLGMKHACLQLSGNGAGAVLRSRTSTHSHMASTLIRTWHPQHSCPDPIHPDPLIQPSSRNPLASTRRRHSSPRTSRLHKARIPSPLIPTRSHARIGSMRRSTRGQAGAPLLPRGLPLPPPLPTGILQPTLWLQANRGRPFTDRISPLSPTRPTLRLSPERGPP